MAETPKRCAVVTGANKGIGFEICRQLASNGIAVVLTARDENRGLEAIKSLKDSGFSDDLLVFHQLDVADQTSIAFLSDFVKSRFGKLDILVNNAGIAGAELNHHFLKAAVEICGHWPDGKQGDWDKIAAQNLQLAKDCLKTNYYGAKSMVEAFAEDCKCFFITRITPGVKTRKCFHNIVCPFTIYQLLLFIMLQNIPNQWAKGVLSDVEGLTEEKINEVVNEFLKDFEDGMLETKGWPTHVSAYTIAKAAMNAYTRILAKKHPNFIVNGVCPGFCRTDITTNLGVLSAAEGAENAVRLALLPKDDAPSGCFFQAKERVDF